MGADVDASQSRTYRHTTRGGENLTLLGYARFEWEREVKRCASLPSHVKQFAFFMASYSTGDTGRDIRPGVAILARDSGLSPRQVKRNVDALRELGLVAEVLLGNRQGRRPRPGTARQGMASEFCLCLPVDFATRYDRRSDESR